MTECSTKSSSETAIYRGRQSAADFHCTTPCISPY